jgi:hypothetical protein
MISYNRSWWKRFAAAAAAASRFIWCYLFFIFSLQKEERNVGRFLREPPSQLPLPEVKCSPTMLFLNFPDLEIAKQLTTIEYKIFSNIKVVQKEMGVFVCFFLTRSLQHVRLMNYSNKHGTRPRRSIDHWMWLRWLAEQTRCRTGSPQLCSIKIRMRHDSRSSPSL